MNQGIFSVVFTSLTALLSSCGSIGIIILAVPGYFGFRLEHCFIWLFSVKLTRYAVMPGGDFEVGAILEGGGGFQASQIEAAISGVILEYRCDVARTVKESACWGLPRSI